MRFFTDTQTPAQFVEFLRQLGWDTRTVYEEGTQNERDDFEHLITANRLDRTLVTFDQLRGEEGAKVAGELTISDDKIIIITGGPEQGPYRALGRFLFHYEEWFSFLDANDGVAILSDLRNNCRLYTPELYSQRIGPSDRKHFGEYLQAQEERANAPPTRRLRQRKLPADEQGELELPS